MTIAQITHGQIEGWVIRAYFSGTLEQRLVRYARYWVIRLGLTRESIIE